MIPQDCATVILFLKRRSAAIKKSTPINTTKVKSSHTSSIPASLNKTACENLTKCVEGEKYIMYLSIAGMLSIGVYIPDSIIITRNTGMARSPNCGIDLAIVAKKIPSEVTEKRKAMVPAINNGIEPEIGTFIRPCTIK